MTGVVNRRYEARTQVGIRVPLFLCKLQLYSAAYAGVLIACYGIFELALHRMIFNRYSIYNIIDVE